MFNLFKKRKDGTKVIDTVLISSTAKYKILYEQWVKNKELIFICWFEASLNEATTFFSNETTDSIPVLLARQVSLSNIKNKIPVFTEHHPLESKELELFRKLNLKTVQVYSALSEPLYKQFGAEKIIDLMKKLGMKDDEAIEHSMISSSIKKAQKKLEKTIEFEQSARSQAEWIQKNVTAKNIS